MSTNSTMSADSGAKVPEDSPKELQVSFLKFPPEVRDMIYDLLVESEYSIDILSLKRKTGSRKKSDSADPNAILRANKQTYSEGSARLYTVNTFTVGNGWWNSSTVPNLKGLQSFIRTVPKTFISLIKNLNIRVSFLCNFDGDAYYLDVHATEDLLDTLWIVQKHFDGVKNLEWVITMDNIRNLRGPSDPEAGTWAIAYSGHHIVRYAVQSLLESLTPLNSYHYTFGVRLKDEEVKRFLAVVLVEKDWKRVGNGGVED
ncbi:uncharacterized protein LY89DRAFT_740662 [Mollisia scopiformis]|uniref:F-box domain-containing protein n=1 Tax=Mollisia scopiformis TaxID=149040 RepID=A0A132BB10_MOLSC|nr:uncharacterized protein LY89DRAFT_740662 [Mollisia scopiformis]KUJ09576.1 hypothetical protein LY89DRAFT_740662 [Mollisia scopiformis]